MVGKEWKRLPLGEVVTLQRGFDLPQRRRLRGSVPVISSSGVLDRHNVAMAKAPGVVTGRYGTIGEVFYIEEDFWPLNTTLFVSDFKGNFPLFISYLLQTIDYQTHSGKSGVPGVNRNDLHEIAVSIPTTLAEQQAIADALSDVDTQIAALDALIEKKQNIKQGAMQRLLTGEERLPGFSGGWEVKKLGDIADVIDPHPSHRAPPIDEYGIPFVGIGDLSIDGTIDYLGARYVSPEVFTEHTQRYDLSNELIGIGRVASIGKVVKLRSDIGMFVVSPTIAVVDPKLVVSGALFYALSTPFVKDQFEKLSSGSTRQSVGIMTLRDVEVYMPTETCDQQAIADVFTDIDNEITALREQRDKVNTIKQGMMQELLTGKTRLV